jgi:hypothetical protein
VSRALTFRSPFLTRRAARLIAQRDRVGAVVGSARAQGAVIQLTSSHWRLETLVTRWLGRMQAMMMWLFPRVSERKLPNSSAEIHNREGRVSPLRRLGASEARQSSFVDAAEFTIEIGGLHIEIGERRDGAWIFLRPVEACARQELHEAVLDARGHAKPVRFDFMQPLPPPREASRPTVKAEEG